MKPKRLWDKGYDVNQTVHRFTVGDDHVLDLEMVEADCLGSVAHAMTLAKAGILSQRDVQRLRKELAAIAADGRAGRFKISLDQEDVHTAIENRLTTKLGDIGKRIHTARSRNDQVIVNTRLWARRRLIDLGEAILQLTGTLAKFANRHKLVPMVGRTHMQRAMPSSVGLWAGAWLEALLDDFELVKTAYALNDQCPLGSAASYGVPVPIDRAYTARLLGFAKAQNNVLYANNSRGKIESIILAACAQIAADLSRVSQDLIVFSMPEFGYFTIPDELTSGSSIMPQKKNPCGLELTRAKTRSIIACHDEVIGIYTALPSGYNRDFQQTKGAAIRGVNLTIDCVRVMNVTFSKLKVNKDRLKAGFAGEVFAVDRALQLVAAGMPFRDAYRKVAAELDQLDTLDPVQAIKDRKGQGMAGNLRLDIDRKRIAAGRATVRRWRSGAAKVLQSLLHS
ncbi:MAG: argininosuccinate lyase [Phycisphaerae bacterium]|nr:argininosuccinate lyase [Phycisphaerae bacterium]